METQTDQGSEIQGGMGTTQIPIDYMDTRMEQMYPSPELGDEEDERLAAVEVEKEEGDYVQQPQPEPNPEPLMEEEPVEVMAREFLPPKPTPEQLKSHQNLRFRNGNKNLLDQMEAINPLNHYYNLFCLGKLSENISKVRITLLLFLKIKLHNGAE
ncbi:unnamed protein product [Sphagnum balticum]